MNVLPDDPERRRWLGAVSVTGSAGVLAAAAPFVASMAPSERARALGAPVEVDLSGMPSGALKTVEWRGKPVFILKRSPAMVAELGRHDLLLADPWSRRSIQPPYAQNAERAIGGEVLVLEGLCTHLGCIPTFRPEPGAADIGTDWPGGFYCPCHGSKFDLAGRVFKNVPAPTNLTVPPYRLASPSSLVVGEDAQA
jgi:ubiquinol-cytochrome c reductase iron-sulfur subunit